MSDDVDAGNAAEELVGVEEATNRSLATVGRNAMYLAAAAAVAQVLAMVRELFLAAQMGISSEFDALLVALGLPVLISNVFINGVSTALVPAFAETRDAHGMLRARSLAGTILCWVMLIGCAVALTLFLLADPVISIAGPGLSAANHDLAVGYLRFLAPLALITAFSGVVYAVCQAEEYFRAIAFANLVGPAVTLVVLVALWNSQGLWAFAAGSLIGPIITAFILLVAAARRHALPRPSLRGSQEAFEVARHAAPLTLSSGLGLLTAIGDKAIATLLLPGAVSALRYADVLVRVPVGVIGPAWSSAIYPTLVRAAQGRGSSELGSTAGLALRYALVVFVPVAAIAAAAAPIVVAIAYGRGAFDAEELRLISQLVAAYAPLIVLLMTAPVLTNSLNAKRQGVSVLKGGALNVGLNLILDVVLGLTLGVAGLALAPAISSSTATAYFARRLGRLDRSFDVARIRRTLRVAILVVIPPAGMAALYSWGVWQFDGLLAAFASLIVVTLVVLIIDMRLATRAGLTEPAAIVEVGLSRAPGRVRTGVHALIGHRVLAGRDELS